MLIPSIDLKDGAVVQLVQGERLAIEDDDVFRWVRRFETFPKVQVIDLDAAMGTRRQPRAGARRSPARCRAASAAASAPSSARATCSPPARSRSSPARRCSRTAHPISRSPGRSRDARRPRRVIAAVDSRGGHVVIHGWKTTLPLTAVEAVRALEPYCDEFLYTHVDTEGLMGGTDLEAILAVRGATTRRVTAAGGITTQQEIDELDALGVDAVVGMAIYTGTLDPERRIRKAQGLWTRLNVHEASRPRLHAYSCSSPSPSLRSRCRPRPRRAASAPSTKPNTSAGRCQMDPGGTLRLKNFSGRVTITGVGSVRSGDRRGPPRARRSQLDRIKLDIHTVGSNVVVVEANQPRATPGGTSSAATTSSRPTSTSRCRGGRSSTCRCSARR